MNKDQIEFINSVIRQWNQENYPEFHVPYKEGDYIFIYGDCTGIVIYPYDDHLGYTWLSEDDGFYFMSEKNPNKAVFWIEEDMKCLEVALNYLEKYGTPLYYKGCEGNENCQCGWKLPWINSNISHKDNIVR